MVVKCFVSLHYMSFVSDLPVDGVLKWQKYCPGFSLVTNQADRSIGWVPALHMIGKVTPIAHLSVVVVISTVLMLLLCFTEVHFVWSFVFLIGVVAFAVAFVLNGGYVGWWSPCCCCRLLSLVMIFCGCCIFPTEPGR